MNKLRNVILLLLIGFVFVVGFAPKAMAQKKDKKSKRNKISYFAKIGDKYFESEEYYLAAQSYNKALRSEPSDVYAAFKLAEAYRLSFDYKKAESAYARVSSMDGKESVPLHKFWHALLLKTNGKYEQSKTEFETFIDEFDPQSQDDKFYLDQAKLEYQGALLAIHEMKKAVRDYKLKVLPKPVNTSYSEYAPVISKHDSALVLTSSRPSGGINSKTDPRFGHGFSNNIRFEKSGNSWSEYKDNDDFDDINTALHDGAGVFNKAHDKFYFTSCYQKDVCEIFVSNLDEDGKWTEPVKLNDNINMEGYPSKQPYLSYSGDTLFFVSSRPGGMGNNDIWMSTKSSGEEWGTARNLSGLNTPYVDMSPCFYINKGEKVLFFSSNGRESFGGLDIFMAKGDDFSYVVNSGLPFNSNRDDFYFVLGDKYGYLSSNRDGGFGHDDIYTFVIDSKSTIIATITQDSITGYESISVAGKLLYDDTKAPAADVSMALSDDEDIEIKTTKTNDKGEFRFDNLSTDKGYKVGVDEEDPNISEKTNIYVDDVKVYGSDKKVSKTLFENIYFDFDKYNLRPEATKVLDELAKYIQENPEVQIEINANTDAIGSSDYNKVLSKKRGNEAKDYLYNKGVDATKIVVNSLGEGQPIAPNSSRTGRRLNRRVEFYILGGPGYSAKAMAYVVQPGNTLTEIAKKYSMSVDELKDINNLQGDEVDAFSPLRVRRGGEEGVIAPSTLASMGAKPGQKNFAQPAGSGRQVPNYSQADLGDNEELHQVGAGETVYGIARKYQMTVAELQKINDIGNHIEVGQNIKVIRRDMMNKDLDESMYYVVKEGDTMYGIAKRYDMTPEELKALNNMDDFRLQLGMVLKIRKARFSE